MHHAEFLRCVLRQMNGHAFTVAFPLTHSQRAAFVVLNTSLQDRDADEPINIAAVQKATWATMSEPSIHQWGNVHQVYWALLALRMDGTYAHATALTPHLAKFTYMMRVASLYNAVHLPADEAVP